MTWIESHAAALDRSVLSLFGKSTSPHLPILILHGDLARPDAPLPARDIERRFASIAAAWSAEHSSGRRWFMEAFLFTLDIAAMVAVVLWSVRQHKRAHGPRGRQDIQ